MRQEYDLDADALYITLRELPDGEHVARTVEIDDSTNVDLDADGNLLGIEVLSPERAWPVMEILQRWEIRCEDRALIFGSYLRVPTVSVTW